MKIVLAGAFGNLGAEILKALIGAGHEVVAADLREGNIEGLAGDDRRRDGVEGGIADARGLGMSADGDVHDLIRIEGDRHRNRMTVLRYRQVNAFTASMTFDAVT